jgi:hypothetical protein
MKPMTFLKIGLKYSNIKKILNDRQNLRINIPKLPPILPNKTSDVTLKSKKFY